MSSQNTEKNTSSDGDSPKSRIVKIEGMKAWAFIALMLISGCVFGAIATNVVLSIASETPQWEKTNQSSEDWEQLKTSVNTPPDEYEYDCGIPDNQLFKQGKVVDSFAVRECFVDGFIDHHFVLLEDGTVWAKTIGHSAMEGSNNFVMLTAATIGGGLLFLLIGIRIVQRKRSQILEEN